MPRSEDLARPPFSIVESLTPARVAAEIVECFETISARRDCLGHGHALAMRSIGLHEDDPMFRAGQEIARDVDRGVGAGVPHGYHNARHFLEVLLCALYLARGLDLPKDRIVRVVTAALIHDFHHDGSRSGQAPFRLESLSAARADPYFRRAGVAHALRRELGALVLATEPRTGVSFARACLAHHSRGAQAPSTRGIPAPLGLLSKDPELALEAVLLAQADVLPSIGLTLAHGEHVQDRLAAEWGTALGPRDKLAFVDRVRDSITIARSFAPNIDALRQAYLERVRALDD